MPTVGVISDTHGLLRPEALEALRGSDHILHAGDVGKESILADLRAIAPVTAVRGNVDLSPWAGALPMTEMVDIAGHSVYMIHILEDIDVDPQAAGVRVVVYGHTHQPKIVERNGVLYLNPGSAGPRRFDLPVTVARLDLEGDSVEARLVEIL